MRNIVFGIVAHVDAGKTTLSEQLLLRGGAVREAGRVDKGTSYLDDNSIERERGITVFSKQARLVLSGRPFTLLDTPGHSDLTGETKSVLSVLDAAILVVPAGTKVNAHTVYLKKLLEGFSIPVIIFVNKTDLHSFDRDGFLSELKERLGEGLIEAERIGCDETAEDLAVLDDELLGDYLDTGKLPQNAKEKLFLSGKLNPVYFGAALKDEGIDALCGGLSGLTEPLLKEEHNDLPFAAKVFSIGYLDRRLTFMKITGGVLKIRDQVVTDPSLPPEKVTELRLYSGSRFEHISEAHAGDIVAAAGLEKTFFGQGLGDESDEPGLSTGALIRVRVVPDPSTEREAFLNATQILSEEEPYLEIETDSKGETYLSITGTLQEEILASLFLERFGITVSFDSERAVYKETIRGQIEGVGHYEPLRHYAEVHLLLSEGERGSGVVIDSQCPEDVLEKTYQKQVMDHLLLLERGGGLRGVLTGSRLTDIRISIVSGKSHVKHTEPGDFREAAVRALRHGLMRAENILLEPVLSFSLSVPQELVGRALNDISNMRGEAMPPETSSDNRSVLITGVVPAAEIKDYHKELSSYTRGEGSLETVPFGYRELPERDDVINSFSYDPERDLSNPAGSIFCAHGAGVYVPWNEVADHMHLPYVFPGKRKAGSYDEDHSVSRGLHESRDVKAIMDGLSRSANQKEKPRGRDRDIEKKRKRETELTIKRALDEKKMPYEGKERIDLHIVEKSDLLLVDGYNMIFSWDELKDLAKAGIDAARGRLNDILSNYSAFAGCETIVVYDAYLLEDHATEILKYNNIHIVFTATAETADQYIEKTAIKRKKDSYIRVATSDMVERMIVLSQGATIMTADNFRGIIEAAEKEIRERL